jgi:hypothetical protein
MRVFICSEMDVVTRLDCDDASTQAQPVLEGSRSGASPRIAIAWIIGTPGAGALLSSDSGQRREPGRDA